MPGSKIEICNVSCRFEGDDGGQVLALDNVQLEFSPGGFYTLLGPSGCGKTTLLNIIAGLTKPTSGSVAIDTRPADPGHDDRVAYMFQRDTLLPWATAAKNVTLPLEARGQKKQGRAEYRGLLQRVGLEGFENRYPYELSGGMRKRVQLARLLAQRASVFLMDEPFGALDAYTKILMQDEFLRLWEVNDQKSTVVWVTHDIYEAIALSDVIVLLGTKPGKVREIIDVPIARPRSVTHVTATKEFQDLFERIWASMSGDLKAQRDPIVSTSSPESIEQS